MSIRFDVRSVSYGSFRRPGVLIPHVGQATFAVSMEAKGSEETVLIDLGSVEITWGCNDDGAWGPVHEVRLIPRPGLNGSMLAHSLTGGHAEPETIPQLVDMAIAYWDRMTERMLDHSLPAAEAVLRVG